MTPTIRYPSGPITPHGSYHILHDRIPQMALRSFDDTIVFNVLGGLAIPDRFAAPERFEIKELKGLIPPWRMIDQKGATQDGTTFVDALYDPCDIEITGDVVGRNRAAAQQVFDHLTGSLDAKQQSTLSFFTHRLGYWWAPIRWGGNAVDPITIAGKRQKVSLRLRADDAFWRSYPCVRDFTFTYAGATDTFDTADANDLGTGWTVSLTGPGTGGVNVEGSQIISAMINNRTMVARKVGYVSTSNLQVGEIEIGTHNDWFYPTNAYQDIWLRMATTGTPGASGVRLRIMRHAVRLSYFVAGVETLLREWVMFIPPQPGERFRLIAGVGTAVGEDRTFRVMRGGATMFTVKETGTGSPMGASNRGAGLGMSADGTQNPAGIRSWAAGDNNTISQSTFLERINVGDQPMWDNYTVYGPGTFRFWNGPNAGANEYVEFGPLESNQVMYLRTDPRKRGVRDMTVTPNSPQAEVQHQFALLDFFSFATANNIGALANAIVSIFGLLGGTGPILTVQGNPYSLLKGRWSRPIPAKSPSKPAEPYHVKVEIVGGNADSKIIATGTPLRRTPF